MGCMAVWSAVIRRIGQIIDLYYVFLSPLLDLPVFADADRIKTLLLFCQSINKLCICLAHDRAALDHVLKQLICQRLFVSRPHCDRAVLRRKAWSDHKTAVPRIFHQKF